MKAKSTLIYGLSVFFGQAMSLVRVILVARVVGIENQGLVVIVGTVVGLVESLMTLGNSWQIVQSKHGDERVFQSSLHMFNAIRGLVVGLGIAVAGPVIESLSGVGGIAGPLLVLSCCSIIRGFTSLGPWLALRTAKSTALAAMEIVPSVSGMLALAVCAWWIQDVWLFVFTQVASAMGSVFCSHFVSRIPYRLSIRTDYLRTIFGFTIPLTGAGFLYWLNVQGDRFIVLFGLPKGDVDRINEELALYGTVAGLALMVGVALSKVMQVKVLYELSRIQDHQEEFRSRSTKLITDVTFVGAGLALACSVAGLWIVVLFLGPDYRPIQDFLLPIGLVVGVQFLRRYLYLVAMSQGNTRVMLLGNLLRTSGVAFAGIAFAAGAGLEGLAWGGTLGEVVSVVGLLLMRLGGDAISFRRGCLAITLIFAGAIPAVLLADVEPGMVIALIGGGIGGSLILIGFGRLSGWLSSESIQTERTC